MSENGVRLYPLYDWCKKLDDHVIEIPIIQRGFVWKPEQIAGLWDSLLRGFPIGSFMVQVKNSNKENVELIDGQQRGRSIAGGVKFKPENGFRVWISCQNNSNAEFTFDLKITTDKHPFGYDAKFKPLSVGQRAKAFKSAIFKKYQNYLLSESKLTPENSLEDMLSAIQEFLKQKNDTHGIHVSLADTKPYSPKTKYVPIDQLFDAIKDKPNTPIVEIVRNAFVGEDKTTDVIEDMAQTIAQALSSLIEKRKLYALEVDCGLHGEADKNKDIDIEVLFKRVGTGGTELSDLDYAYSLLKQRVEGTREYINRLLSGDQVSSLFSSLDCVDLLIRVSCFEAFIQANDTWDSANHTDQTDKANCDKKALFRKIDANEELIRQEFDKPRLPKALSAVVAYLKFDAIEHEKGLPIQLLQRLPKKLWQLFIILVYARGLLRDDRRDLSKKFVRIAIYCVLVAPTADEIAKLVHKFINKIKAVIKDEKQNTFDFEAEFIDLMQTYPRKKHPSFAKLLDISTFKELTLSKTDTFESIHIKYNLDLNERDSVGKLFWRNKNLLLWLQRDYLHQLNSDDGLKVLSDITLYDFDHIIPQNLWSGNSSTAKKLQNEYLKNGTHWQLGNSIGNFQLLKFSDNRAKKSAVYNEWMMSLGIDKKQVMTHSFLVNSDQYFSKTIEKHEPWTKDQSDSFVKAVETRVIDLYAELLTVYDGPLIYFEKE